MRKERLYITLSVCLTIVIASTWFVRAGSITPPPGPVGGTMHTLDEIFAAVTAIGGTRIPIDALPFAIGAPGSYLVTADLASVGLPGITVMASDVTIDLDGHDLAGAMAGPGEDCIVLTPGFDNVTVFNGSIHDWGGDGLDLSAGAGHHGSDLTVESCGENGVMLGPDSVFSKCVVRFNAGDGLVTFGNSRIENLVAEANGFPGGVGPGGGDGIFLGGINDTLIGCALSGNFDDGVGIGPAVPTNNTAHDCTADGNGFGSGAGAGFNGLTRLTDCSANLNAADGFFAASGGAVVVNCVANGNVGNGFNVSFTHVSDCEASANGANGILALQCRIRDCNVTGNFGDGIEGGAGNFISGNNVNGNGVNGIVLTGAANTIENNHCTFNGAFGIDTGTFAPGLANAVFANRATGGFGGPGPDYFLDPANTAGPIVGPGPVGAGYGLNIVY
jgi:parallel beta-helix repeat protein